MTRLRSLGLQDIGLHGAIPSELGQLAELTLLVLADQKLSGTLPTELGLLTQLGKSDLSKEWSGACYLTHSVHSIPQQIQTTFIYTIMTSLIAFQLSWDSFPTSLEWTYRSIICRVGFPLNSE